MKNPLKPGRYMKVDTVSYFLCNNFPSQFKELSSLQIYPGEYDTYYSTSDLKKIMSESLFKEMECECTTHVILSESDLQAYYNNELNA